MIQVDKEQVRILVADHGYQEAERITGIKYATLRQWAKRHRWKAAQTHSQALVTTVTPAQAQQDTLQEHGNATKLAGMKAARKGAEHLAKASPGAIVKQSGALQKLMQAGAIAGSWNEGAPNTAIQVNVLSFAAIKPSQSED